MVKMKLTNNIKIICNMVYKTQSLDFYLKKMNAI